MKKVSNTRIIIDMFMTLFAGRNSKYLKRVNKLALARDGYKCKVCSSTERLEVHHYEGWAKNRFLRFVLSNLVTLCYECHRGSSKSYHAVMGYNDSTLKKYRSWRRKK